MTLERCPAPYLPGVDWMLEWASPEAHMSACDRGECHLYQGHEYHFCHEESLREFDRRLRMRVPV